MFAALVYSQVPEVHPQHKALTNFGLMRNIRNKVVFGLFTFYYVNNKVLKSIFHKSGKHFL